MSLCCPSGGENNIDPNKEPEKKADLNDIADLPVVANCHAITDTCKDLWALKDQWVALRRPMDKAK